MDAGRYFSGALEILHSICTTSGINWALLMHSFFIHLQKLLVNSQGHFGLNYLPLYVLGNTTNQVH